MLQPWQQELTQCIRTLDQLERYIPSSNREALQKTIGNMRLSITPHTLKRINFQDPQDPILLMSVPQERELRITPEEMVDPIGDEAKSPIPFLTHRYPDRALIYVTFFCSAYCRFCFRRFKTGQATPGPSEQDRLRMMRYLHDHAEVEEVILTGGDPLTLLDEQLAVWLKALRDVPSVKRIRIHTRVPVNLPSRMTPELIDTLRHFMDARHPIYIVTHFNHVREIAEENVEAIARLVDAGIIVRNQSVLLKGVNDRAEILSALFRELVNIRVVPYYLHQLDLARGTGHFRVPVKQGIELMRSLQGHLTGIAMPRYMLDIPGGQGKIPLQYGYTHQQKEGVYLVENYQGEMFTYREPE